MAKVVRTEALEVLKRYKQEFAIQYGVQRIGIFGSVARDEANATSDLDVVVEMAHPDIFSMVHIKDLLESAIGCHVDIIRYRHRMNRFLRQRIDQEAIYV